MTAGVRGVGSSRMNELLGGSHVGPGVQVSILYPALLLADAIAGASKDYEGLGLGRRRTRVTGRPAFWRESMNEVNASAACRL